MVLVVAGMENVIINEWVCIDDLNGTRSSFLCSGALGKHRMLIHLIGGGYCVNHVSFPEPLITMNSCFGIFQEDTKINSGKRLYRFKSHAGETLMPKHLT